MIDLISSINERFPKLYVKTKIKDDLRFTAENNNGYIEYKRSIANCNSTKIIKYATQMKWRASENKKSTAIYYLGVNDDGTIQGLTEDQILPEITRFVEIVESIQGSIATIRLIYVHQIIVIECTIRIKNLKMKFETI